MAVWKWPGWYMNARTALGRDKADKAKRLFTRPVHVCVYALISSIHNMPQPVATNCLWWGAIPIDALSVTHCSVALLKAELLPATIYKDSCKEMQRKVIRFHYRYALSCTTQA